MSVDGLGLARQGLLGLNMLNLVSRVGGCLTAAVLDGRPSVKKEECRRLPKS